MGITAPLCIECCAAGAFSTRTRGSMKPVFLRSCRDLCKYKMYKPALTATAKQILFVLAAEQIMRQADTQIFSLEGDDFLISVAAGRGMTGRGGASNPPPSSLHLNLNSLSVFAIRATSCASCRPVTRIKSFLSS